MRKLTVEGVKFTYRFVPIFLFVHKFELGVEYEITYVKKNDINIGENCLHSVYMSGAHECLTSSYSMEYSHANRYTAYKEGEVLGYNENIYMQKEELRNELKNIDGDVEDVRYICLIKKVM